MLVTKVMFVFKGKEWLCLNCQVKRASGAGEPGAKSGAAKGAGGHTDCKATTSPKTTQHKQSQLTFPQQNTGETSQTPKTQSCATESGEPKSQPRAVNPTESVKGKMFGFGSSIFSSASTLISTAVHDNQKTTPPVSPKLTTAMPERNISKKSDQDIAKDEVQKTKILSLSTCPLCKAELNVGSKDPPNYRACTECKNVVCNHCGFNSMPNAKEVSQ